LSVIRSAVRLRVDHQIGRRRTNEGEQLHNAVLSKGMKPMGEPKIAASGNREFVLRDLDGYKLAFLQKK
jgi:hypothetical protein